MEQNFFVSFAERMEEDELFDIVSSLNDFSNEETIFLSDYEFCNGHRGYFVWGKRNLQGNSPIDILTHKYCERYLSEPDEVFFFSAEYARILGRRIREEHEIEIIA